MHTSLRTCVSPGGTFRVGIHRPAYTVANLRRRDHILNLGQTVDGVPVDNRMNFPRDADLCIEQGRPVYEIANAFAFRGATFIDSGWADSRAGRSDRIRIHAHGPCSLRGMLGETRSPKEVADFLARLPKPLQYALAATSTDREELTFLARSCCRMAFDGEGEPTGLVYKVEGQQVRPDIDDFELFETIANNANLPDRYKEVMVLRPGVQGTSAIVGEMEGSSHVFEYLRANSYIPWGHYAANFAHDCIRYSTAELGGEDIGALRHLYYQRIYCILAGKLGLGFPRETMSEHQLETLRKQILAADSRHLAEHPATLWGWNYGYDFSGSGFRLHASHQMIHQQYAMVPERVELLEGGDMPAYACGDPIADQMERYRRECDSDFFSDYLAALRSNHRIDGRDLPASLTVWEDEHVMLFIPKAQTSQWEMQLLVTADSSGEPIGNVIEANTAVRSSLDSAILKAQHIYAGLGATMVSSIEYPKRFAVSNGQRLLYSFLPKLPWSMGAFSEAQSRFILGHYPEDFAEACRMQLAGGGA